LEHVALGLDVVLRGRGDLAFILVEIERGVELRLPREQVLYTRLVLERLIGLLPVIGEDAQKAARRLVLQGRLNARNIFLLDSLTPLRAHARRGIPLDSRRD
jgi:hypothetical protein